MFKIIKNKKNYKLVIGIFLGIIFSTSIVYALYYGRANQLSYDSSNNWLRSNNVQDALDELAKQKDCPFGYSCYEKKSTLALGDYVSYTPSKTSYTTDTAMTGYTDTQTINPSELNLWRVISLNQDGTVDIISENVSSTDVFFKGQTGYLNYVGYLKVLASQYETSGITVGSRYFGFNGQTPFIDDTRYFTNPAPWTCGTNGNCTPDPDDYEAYGGGDTLYLSDYNLVYNVLGTRIATKPNGEKSPYWVASRQYVYSNPTGYNWSVRRIHDYDGSTQGNLLYGFSGSSFYDGSKNYALRPIVTLDSSLSYYGVGNKYFPMEIQES